MFASSHTMNVETRVAAALLAAACLSCGMLGTAFSFNPTTTPSNGANYGALEAAAKQRGWRVHRGSSSEYNLSVYPAEGEAINFNEDLNSHNISYMCEGARFDKDDALCAAEVRKLCVAAFKRSCEDFD